LRSLDWLWTLHVGTRNEECACACCARLTETDDYAKKYPKDYANVDQTDKNLIEGEALQ